jgi:hypothetical protein
MNDDRPPIWEGKTAEEKKAQIKAALKICNDFDAERKGRKTPKPSVKNVTQSNGNGHVPQPEVEPESNGEGAREDNGEAVGLVTTCLATIRMKPVHYLVPKYVPKGKLTMTAGDGGHGKSTTCLYKIACFTTGRPCFGLEYDPPEPFEALIVSCEDDYADTVVPILVAAGADLSKIHRVDGVKGKDGKTLPFNLACYKAMEEELQRRPNVRYVLIDPAGAYIGKAGVDDHKDSELRSLLDPMAELCARLQVTIELIKHFHKGASASAVHKVSGAAGYVNTVRSSFVVLPDRDEEDVKLLLPLKFNVGKKPEGLRFRRDPLPADEAQHILDQHCGELNDKDRAAMGEQLSRITWLGTTNATADEELKEQAKKDRGPNKVELAKEWVRTFLVEFAYPSDEIMTAGMAAGHNFDNLKRAKAALKPEGLWSTNKGGFQGEWWCGFNKPEIWKLRPEKQTVQPSAQTAPPAQSAQSAQTGLPECAKSAKCAEGGESANDCTDYDYDGGKTPFG